MLSSNNLLETTEHMEILVLVAQRVTMVTWSNKLRTDSLSHIDYFEHGSQNSPVHAQIAEVANVHIKVSASILLCCFHIFLPLDSIVTV